MLPPVEFLIDRMPGEFPDLAVQAGGKPFHGRIMRRWIYKGGLTSFDEITDLPQSLRKSLAERYVLNRLTSLEVQKSADGTEKAAFSLHDGNIVETVLIPDRNRKTVCISSQVGCPVGCRFCASGLKGFKRNLASGEMVEQVVWARSQGPDSLTNIVFMGTGEPLLNLENLKKAIQVINHSDGLNIGARRITVSTVGYPDRIRELAALGLQINLAISLHAADDAKRQSIVPTADKVPITAILAAADDYRQRTTRDVTFEYVLIGGVNDSSGDAETLAALLKGRKGSVNVIAWNKVEGVDLQEPSPAAKADFLARLMKRKIPATLRESRGDDIAAACGQLRLKIERSP